MAENYVNSIDAITDEARVPKPVATLTYRIEQKKAPLVLVVDDDTSVVCAINGFLKRAGFLSVSAADVAEALQRIRELHPDLILLDLNLPDGSGFDVCRSLTSEPTAITSPILLISASEDTSTKVQGFEMGGVDYITKPIVGAEVIARVRTHLRLKQAYERLSELQADRLQRLASAQRDLMPKPIKVPGARFQASVRQVLPAGGDFYDVIPAGQDVVDYLVADASGHDLAASLWTASLKALAADYAGPLSCNICRRSLRSRWPQPGRKMRRARSGSSAGRFHPAEHSVYRPRWPADADRGGTGEPAENRSD